MKIDINKIEKGSVFSELNFLRAEEVNKDSVIFTVLGTGEKVTYNNNYVTEFLNSTQYTETIKVTKNDTYFTEKDVENLIKSGKFKNELEIPKVGELKQLGIRSLWDHINNSDVFSVTFYKKEKALSDKQIKEKKNQQITDAITRLEAIKTSKKGVFEHSKAILKEIQDNPILEHEEKELRTLIGRKKSFKSISGFYDVYDLEIDGDNNIRQVNVDKITELIVGGTKYVVEQ